MTWGCGPVEHLPFTPVWNFLGNPAVALPVHHPGGLPVGVRLVASLGREDMLLAVAAQLEQAVPWADRRPDLAAGRL